VIESGNGLDGVADIGDASLRHAGEFVNALDVRLDVEVRILGEGDGQGSADQIDILVADLGTHESGESLGKRVLAMVAHGFMLAEMRRNIRRIWLGLELITVCRIAENAKVSSRAKRGMWVRRAVGKTQIPRRFAPRNDNEEWWNDMKMCLLTS
jgi:hypothetical protein